MKLGEINFFFLIYVTGNYCSQFGLCQGDLLFQNLLCNIYYSTKMKKMKNEKYIYIYIYKIEIENKMKNVFIAFCNCDF